MEHARQHKADFFLKSIYKKAWTDKSFLRKLVKNPIQTLNSFTGKKGALPNGKVLIVEDQTNPDHIYLNIPVKPMNSDNTELNEDQLDTVTGAGNHLKSTSWHLLYSGVKKEIRSFFEI